MKASLTVESGRMRLSILMFLTMWGLTARLVLLLIPLNAKMALSILIPPDVEPVQPQKKEHNSRIAILNLGHKVVS